MSEIRGVWIANRPHSRVLESRGNIAEALDFLKLYGFNVIFPVVWNRGYTLYPSRVMSRYDLPTIDPFYAQQQRDPLVEIVTEANQRNIKVIPWLEYGFASSHLADGGHILKRYPEWQALNCDREGVRHGSLTWMNGFLPEVQQFMTDICIEIVGNYDVDGIQGCDRLPALPVTAGYDDYTVEQYRLAYGERPPRNYKNQQWVQWRADLLTEFLIRLVGEVKTVKPQAIVSLSPAVYPFCLDNLLQDTKVWSERGLGDIFHPQIYRANFSSYKQEVKKLTKTFVKDNHAKFAPGIAFTANGKRLSHKDLMQCIKLNRDRGLGGQLFFHYEGLRRDNDAIAIALSESAGYDRLALLPACLA